MVAIDPAAEHDPRLEWGYQKRTVTFANEKRAEDAEAQDLDLPSAKDARKIVFDKTPDKLQEWREKGWAKHVLAKACVFGPVEGRRWRGRRAEIDDSINIEVWALPKKNGTGTESIVEVSFKKKGYDAKAKAKRGKLLEFLRGKRWLLEEDVLKTELILKRSGQLCPPSRRVKRERCCLDVDRILFSSHRPV